MKKFLIIVLFFMSFLCSCSIGKEDYYDLSEINSITYRKAYPEYERLHNLYYKRQIFFEVIEYRLYTKESLDIEDYKEVVELYGVEFEKLLQIAMYQYDENRNKEVKVYNEFFQFSSSKEAKKVYDDMFYDSKEYILEKNLIYIDCYAAKILLGKKMVQRFDFVLDENLENLYSGIDCKGELKILPGVKTISRSAFKDFKITSLICNEGLEKIEHAAFTNNYSLSSITLNQGLKYIGDYAFSECEKLEWVVIPESVTHMGWYVFTYGNIFCEVESKPKGWDKDFAYDDARVYYKGEWKYDENNIPYVINNQGI